MRRSNLVLAQTIVVVFIVLVVLVVLSRGEVRWVSDAEAPEQIALSRSTVDGTPVSSPVSGARPTPASTSSTPLPPTPTATIPPSPTATVAPSPTSTPPLTPTPMPSPSPAATERPAAPPTGLDDESLIVSQAETGRMEMALTFDAGDGRGYTLEILDVLDQYGVRSSFGVTGAWSEANPDLLREIVDRGHHVMNHTYSHRSFTGNSPGTEPLTPEERRSEIVETEEIIREIAGYEVAPYFRFPYGDYDRSDLALLKELGYDYTMWWGCDSLAWMGSTAEDIVQRCGVEGAAPGAVVLLHVDPEADFEALPGLIETLQADGYELVTLEQLIQP